METLVDIGNSWQGFFDSETEKEYYQNLRRFLSQEYKTQTIYPPPDEIFNAFKITPFEKVKVVVLGQDPYHTPNTAMGLAFSVKPHCVIPPSLRNIYQEIDNEYGEHYLKNGDLTPWAQQGVFLLNTTLTVRQGKPASHFGRGWERFTNEVISLLNADNSPKVFMLWGKNAKDKHNLITNEHHLVLEAAHPSPFSAYNGFFGCNHFRLANQFLRDNDIDEVVW